MSKTIRNCKFAFKCNAQWEQLDRTSQQDVRHCRVCQRDVYLCDTDQSIAEAIRQNRCVAIEDPEGSLMLLGELEAT